MPILTTDFSSLTDDLESIFNEVSKSKIAEMVGPKIFNVGDTARKTHEHLVLHGIAGVEDVSEGQDLPKVTGEEGKIIAFFKFQLINWENLKFIIKVTHNKLIEKIKNSILQLQRLSVGTLNISEATVRTYVKA